MTMVTESRSLVPLSALLLGSHSVSMEPTTWYCSVTLLEQPDKENMN